MDDIIIGGKKFKFRKPTLRLRQEVSIFIMESAASESKFNKQNKDWAKAAEEEIKKASEENRNINLPIHPLLSGDSESFNDLMEKMENEKWKQICELALEKTFLWKHFNRFPKVLRFDVCSPSDSEALTKSFFAHWEAILKKPIKQSATSGISLPSQPE